MTVPIVPGPGEPYRLANLMPAPPAKNKGLSGPAIAGIAVGGSVLLVALCCGAFVALGRLGGSPSAGPSGQPGIKDVKLTSCDRDEFAYHAGIAVTNSTSHKAYYSVTVDFENSAGGRVGHGYTLVNDVAPGQTAYDKIVSFASDGQSVATCRVVDVVRA